MQTPTDELIALICKALTERFPQDRTRPGLVISHLAKQEGSDDQSTFYVSAVRYPNQYGAAKEVIHQARELTLDDAVLRIAEALTPQTPIVVHQRALARAIGGSK